MLDSGWTRSTYDKKSTEVMGFTWVLVCLVSQQSKEIRRTCKVWTLYAALGRQSMTKAKKEHPHRKYEWRSWPWPSTSRPVAPPPLFHSPIWGPLAHPFPHPRPARLHCRWATSHSNSHCLESKVTQQGFPQQRPRKVLQHRFVTDSRAPATFGLPIIGSYPAMPRPYGPSSA